MNICNHHNLLFKKSGNYRHNLNKIRLTEEWYQYNIIIFDIEFYETKIHYYGEMIRKGFIIPAYANMINVHMQ